MVFFLNSMSKVCVYILFYVYLFFLNSEIATSSGKDFFFIIKIQLEIITDFYQELSKKKNPCRNVFPTGKRKTLGLLL